MKRVSETERIWQCSVFLDFCEFGPHRVGLRPGLLCLLVNVDFKGKGKSLPNVNEAHKNGIVFRRDVSESFETHIHECHYDDHCGYFKRFVVN